jgi:hypothetical protein
MWSRKKSFFLHLVFSDCHQRWDRSTIDIHFWWSVVSLARIYKYVK